VKPRGLFRGALAALTLASAAPLAGCADPQAAAPIIIAPALDPASLPMCGVVEAPGAGAAPDGGADDALGAAPLDPASSPDASTPDADSPTPGPADASPAAPPPGRVVLISIDGLRPDALVRAGAENILALACRGAHSWRAQTISPSITLPSHASMVSGYTPREHGLYHNDLRPGYIPVPTIFQIAKEAGRRTVLVVGKEKLLQLAPPRTFDVFVWAPAGDQEVADKAILEAQRGFDLMFVHFPNVDLAGHGTQWMSERYLQQVDAADAAVGRLLAALPPETTVIVTADHGGHGYGHFEGLPVDSTIPWIIAGPRIRRGHTIAQAISTVDSAATAAHVLGLSLRPDALGRLVQEAFLH
jgi:hypothetical protein